MEFKTEVNIRHNDGIHFNPYGHRCITKILSEFMMKLKEELSTTGATTSSSSSSINNLSLLQTNSSKGFTQDNNKFNGYDNRRKFDNKQQNDYNDKRIKLDPAAEEFSLAFATAWKKFSSLK